VKTLSIIVKMSTFGLW